MQKKKADLMLFAAALLWWLLSFAYERIIFDMSALPGRLFTYIHIKLLLLPLITGLLWFLRSALRGRKERSDAFNTLVYSIPYLVIFVVGCCLTHNLLPWGDEKAICASAKAFDNDKGMFTYMTTYIHMLALQLIPNTHNIMVFKIAVSGLALGYSVNRVNRLYGSSFAGFLLYGIFLVPVSFGQGVSSHRMPMYGMLALFFAVKLYCDHKEKKKLSTADFFIMAFCAAVLTQWRLEGIYMLVLAPVLLLLGYRIAADKKTVVKLTAIMLLIQALVYYPQYRETAMNDEMYSSRRSENFYNFIMPNMLRCGLDREKNADELAIVDKYLNLKVVDEINGVLGNILYTDEYISWYDGFECIRPTAGDEELVNYEHAVQRIVIKNPLIYIKAQLNTFVRISFSYGSDLSGIIKTVCGNLFVPIGVLLAVWIAAIKKKDLFLFFCMSGPLCHTAITTALLPAGYFKYYYMQFIIAGLAAVLMIIRKAAERSAKTT